MSNEHAPTGGEGATTNGGASVSDEGAMTGEDLDALFEILADDQRRHILTYLEERDEDVAAFSELIDHVADERVGDPTDDHERVAVRLHHAHLPKLADLDLVEYDARSETVRYRGGPAVSEWLTLARSHEPDAS
jgi:hypothetical protein